MRWPEVVKSPQPTFSRWRLGNNSMQLGHSKFKISWHYEELQYKKTKKQADILNFLDATACRPISGFPDPIEGVWRKRKEERGKGTLCCDKKDRKSFFLGFCLYLFHHKSRQRRTEGLHTQRGSFLWGAGFHGRGCPGEWEGPWWSQWSSRPLSTLQINRKESRLEDTCE